MAEWSEIPPRLYEKLESRVVEMCLHALPGIPPKAVRESAYSLYALIEGLYLLQAWNRPRNRLSAGRKAAHAIIDSLLEKYPPKLAAVSQE